MPIPIGVLAQAGAGSGGLTNDYERISTTTLGSDTNTVTFSSIPSTFTHLQIRMVIEGTTGNLADPLTMRLNGSSGAVYGTHRLRGDGSSLTSIVEESSTSLTNFYFDRLLGDPMTPAIIEILDYKNTNKNKTIRVLGGFPGSAGYVALWSGLWRSTDAITSISFIPFNGNIKSASRLSLYGIRG